MIGWNICDSAVFNRVILFFFLQVCPEEVNRNVHETSRHTKAQHAVNTVETRRDTTIRRRIDRQPNENKIPFEEIAATRTIEKFLCDLQVLILISSGVCSP